MYYDITSTFGMGHMIESCEMEKIHHIKNKNKR